MASAKLGLPPKSSSSKESAKPDSKTADADESKTVRLELRKTTKGTYVYAEENGGPMTVYIPKARLEDGPEPPPKLRLTIKPIY